MASYKYCLPILLGSLSLLGCGSLPSDKSDAVVALQQPQLTAAGVNLELTESERLERVETLLKQPLTPNRAMELMLINSPHVSAELAELGIAQAQQLQAGLLSNPQLAIGALHPEGGGRWQLDAGISQSIVDVFTRPLRRQLADAEFTAAQIKLHLRLNQQLYDVQHLYYQTLAAREQAQVGSAQRHAAEANLSLAQSLFDAGNIPERELLQYQLEVQAQTRQLRASETHAEQQVNALSALLGFDSSTVLQLPHKLPSLPTADNFNHAALLTTAKYQRQDLQLAQAQLHTAENNLALQNKVGAFTEIELGATVERESDGSYKAGPEVAFSLPIFDRGHARLQRTQAEILYSTSSLQAQEIQADIEISNALLALSNARASIEEIEKTSLPLQHKVQALKLREYNFMLSSAFELIQLKQQEFALISERINALRTYWQARSELALASGQSLAVNNESEPEPEPEPEPEKKSPQVDHSMHDHGDHHHD